jgi:CRISPR-associated protein Cmr2
MKGLERFPSTAEISTLQLYQFAPNVYDEFLKDAETQVRSEQQDLDLEEENAGENDDILRKFYELLFANKSQFVGEGETADFRPITPEPHHKYFCSVYADGDNFKSVITQLGTDVTAIEAFSQKLTDYATQAAGIINDFGGKPVFIGGDDLVFLAPIVANAPSGRPRTVFNLLEALNQAFDVLELGKGLPIKPSMSYGITLSFYKFPLFEAQELSRKQLNDRAKKAEWSGAGKKATTAFRLLKHSGSYFEGAMNHQLLQTFNNLVDHFTVTTASKNADQAGKFLTSFAFKLRELEDLMVMAIAHAGTVPISPDSLDHFFENYFNEPIHKRHQVELSMIKDFARDCYGQTLTINDKPASSSDNFYALLRLLDFMTPKTILKPTAQTNSANEPAHV